MEGRSAAKSDRNTFQISTFIPKQGDRGAGACPSMHWMEGRGTPRSDHQSITRHTHTYSRQTHTSVLTFRVSNPPDVYILGCGRKATKTQGENAIIERSEAEVETWTFNL